MVYLCMFISRPLLCVRVCVTGGRRCAPPVPTRQPSSLQEPALWCVCGTWLSTRTNSLTWNSDRLVCLHVCLQFNSNILNVFAHTYTLNITPIHFFFIAVIWSHRFSDMPGCVWGPQHDSKWLPWPHLYPVGYGGAKLRHPVSGTHNQHLCTGYQWTHRKATFLISFFVILFLHNSENLSFSSPSSVLCHFWLTVVMLIPFIQLAAWGRKDSHCWKHAYSLCVCFAFLCISVCIFAQMGINTILLCPRVRLRHVRDLCSTCGPWRVSCWPALTLPAGLWQTSCVSASLSDTSGMPRMSSSLAVQTASYGWVFLYLCNNETETGCLSLQSMSGSCF